MGDLNAIPQSTGPINPQTGALPVEQQAIQPVKADTLASSSGTASGMASAVKMASPDSSANHPTLKPLDYVSKNASTSSLLQTEFEKVITQLLPELNTPDEATDLTNQIRNYMEHGVALENPAVQELALKAGVQIQQAFKLPEVYNPQQIIKTEKVGDPIALAETRQALLQDNLGTFSDNMLAIMESLMVTQDVLAKTREQQMKRSFENTELQKSLQASRDILGKESAAKDLKNISKANSMKFLGAIMKVLGPSIAVVPIVGGAICTALTGGVGALASPLFLAGVAVGAAMMTYSIVDGQVGATAAIMDQLNKLVDSLTEDLPEWAAPLVKAAIVVGAVAAAALLVVATAGAGSGAVTNAAAKVLVETLEIVIKQMTIQATIILLLSSNVIIENVEMIGKACGLDESQVEILKYTAMALQMVAILAVAIKASGSGGGKAASAVATEGQTIAQNAQEVAKTIAKDIQNFANQLIETVKDIPNLATNVKTSLLKTLEGMKLFFGSEKLLARLGERFFKSLPALLSIASGTAECVFSAQTAQILRSQGNIEYEMTVFEEQSENVQKMTTKAIASSKDMTDAIDQCQDIMNGMLNAIRRVADKVFQYIQLV